MTDQNPGWWPYGAEFPQWDIWRGVDRLCYARLRAASQPMTVRGEDAVDLRDQIRAVALTRPS